jgi:CBS domain-containing protein
MDMQIAETEQLVDVVVEELAREAAETEVPPHVSWIMHHSPLPSLQAGENAVDALAAFRAYDVDALPVFDGATLVGVIDRGALLDAIWTSILGARYIRVESIMDMAPVVAHPDADAVEAVRWLAAGHPVVPVLRWGRLVGVLSTSDLVRYLERRHAA